MTLGSAKRRGGRRRFKGSKGRHLEKMGGTSMAHFYMPGSEELYNSLISKEAEQDYLLKDMTRIQNLQPKR